MGEPGEMNQRLQRFHALYEEVMHVQFDLDEFVADALYAFQVLEVAARADSEALRNLAAHLQVDLETGVESITIRPLDPAEMLNATRKMQVIRESSSPSGETADRRRAVSVAPETASHIEQLLALYKEEFGRAFDIEEFVANDLYGRAVIKQVRGSSNPSLLAAVEPFLDEQGLPKRHRRRSDDERAEPISSS
jgi:hypothetical protein